MDKTFQGRRKKKKKKDMILYKDQEIWAHHGLIFISGMGAHVKKTVSSRKDLRPHTSDRAPISGALRNDSRP